MTEVFVDTSAFYGILVPEDSHHDAAWRAFEQLDEESADLICSDFVVHETIALLQARHGVDPVRRFWRSSLLVAIIVPVGAKRLERAMSALLAAGRREVSLTDWTSFEVMRDRGIRQALAFDPHFAEQGFELVA